MINIRNNVFETNSSSSHALVYSPKSAESICFYDDLSYYIDDGVLYIGTYDGLYYGRAPFKILYDVLDKIRYAYANFYDNNELLDVVKELYPEVTRISPYENKFQEQHEYPEKSAGVDCDYLHSWMRKYNFTLKDFITDPHYVVIVDGDEYCIWEDMKELGIVNGLVDMEQRKKSDFDV